MKYPLFILDKERIAIQKIIEASESSMKLWEYDERVKKEIKDYLGYLLNLSQELSKAIMTIHGENIK